MPQPALPCLLQIQEDEYILKKESEGGGSDIDIKVCQCHHVSLDVASVVRRPPCYLFLSICCHPDALVLPPAQFVDVNKVGRIVSASD
jgi:hypothetical protein